MVDFLFLSLSPLAKRAKGYSIKGIQKCDEKSMDGVYLLLKKKESKEEDKGL